MMESQRDLIGPNINALQNRVCVEYASTVGAFRRKHIESTCHSLKFVDVASKYTLITPSNVEGLTRCDHSCALFTVMEQQPIKRKNGLAHAHSVLVSIKCEYINIKQRVNKYLFQVAADHDVCNDGYFHQIHVNQNGSLLLLVSASAIYVVKLPIEMSYSQLYHEETTKTYLHSEILRAEVLLDTGNSKGKPSRQIVKVEFHSKYNNTICALSMEPREASIQVTNEQEIDSSYRAKDPPTQLQGVVRIFDVEESLDTPFLEMHLTEQMCRTGSDDGNHGSAEHVNGAVVDFIWNTRDQSAWGESTVFVISNYGFVFVYCPILLPVCLTSFKRKKAVVRAAAKLLKQGYSMKVVKEKKNITIEQDIADLLSCIANISHKGEPERVHPVEFNIIPQVLKLETDNDVMKLQFDNMMVLGTEPLLTVLATALDGSLFLFKREMKILPRTSRFWHQLQKKEILHMPRIHVNRTCASQFGTKTYLVEVSQNACLLHSALETNLVSIEHDCIEMTKVSQARMADEHVYYHSHPIVLLCSGEKNTDDAFPMYFQDPRNKAYLVQGTYCYLKSQEKLKYLAMSIVPMPYREKSRESVILESVNLQKMDITTRVSPGIALTNIRSDTYATVNSSMKMSLERLNQCALNMERVYREAFRNLRQLVGRDMPYKEKTVEMVKGLSKLDTDVMLYLKAREPIQSTVTQAIQSHQDMIDQAKDALMGMSAYAEKIEQMKERVEKLKKGVIELRKREQRVFELENELKKMKLDEHAAIRVTDLITRIYLKWSNKISQSLACNVQSKGTKLNSYKECLTDVVNQWVGETFQKNTELMEETFKRIQNIRSRTIQLE